MKGKVQLRRSASSFKKNRDDLDWDQKSFASTYASDYCNP